MADEITLILRSTTTVRMVNGAPCRLWIGHEPDTGVPVHAYIATVQPQTDDEDVHRLFAGALEEVHLVEPAIDLRGVS